MLNETLTHQSLQLLSLSRRPRIFLIWQAVPGTNVSHAQMLLVSACLMIVYVLPCI